MPGHIATPPTQILGHLLRRTTQKADGVRKFDPEIVRRFTGPSLASERYTRKRLLKAGPRNGRSPHTSQDRSITLGQLNLQHPELTDIVIQPKYWANV